MTGLRGTIRRFVLVTPALVLAVPLLGFTGIAVADTWGTLVITSDTTLTEDHNGSIVIETDNVTLDCAGHSVSGPGEFDAGILLDGRSDVTIKDCHVSGFAIGFFLTSSSGNTFESNLISGNEHEGVVSVGGSSENVFVGNTSQDNGTTGFFFEGADRNVLRNNASIGNGLLTESGGFFLSSSSQNLLQANLSVGNGENGFGLAEGSNGNVLDKNEARANLWNGIVVGRSDNNTFSMNRTVGNFRGFHLAEVSNSLLLWNEAVGNEGFGFELHEASDMTWRGNSAVGNDGGFLLDAVNQSVFTGNTARNTGGFGGFDFGGFEIGGSGNEFRGNSSVRNAGVGFRIFDGSSDNVFVGNTSQDNGTDGFFFEGADRNVLRNNASIDNGLLTESSGFFLTSSSQNLLQANLSVGNGFDGFGLGEGSNGNVLDKNEARANLQNGIAVVGNNNNTLSMNRAEGNFRGFYLAAISNSLVLWNKAVGNEGFGFELHQASDMTWRGNSAVGNDGGFLIGGESGTVNQSVFTGNTARNTGGFGGFDFGGFEIRGSGNEFRGNRSLRNAGVGFGVFDGSSDNVFEMNQANQNGDIGFNIDGANDNVFEMNRAMLNGVGGFYVLGGSNGNTLTRNVACRNGELDAFEAEDSDNVWEANVFCTSDIL